MSRQLKKKTAVEKRKKKAASENKNKIQSFQTASITKSVAGVPKPLTPKLEKKTVVQSGETNHFQKAIEFFKEVKLELSKVIWPTKKHITGMTIVVIIFVLIVSMFLGLFDLGLSTLVQVILT
jgi:preprotein translocase subunit SecE